MSKNILFTLLLLSQLTQGQDSLVIYRWANAVLNLEKRTSKGIESGTAILLQYKNRQYLITAAHVVDFIHPNGVIDLNKDIFLRKDFYDRKVNDSAIHKLSIMSPPGLEPYLITDRKIDLGIICLGAFGGYAFKDMLIKNHYKPVDISDVDTTAVGEGENILAIGYPSTSLREEPDPKGVVGYFDSWHSGFKGLPILTEGKVQVNNAADNFFYGSIAVFHGFSGGPLIRRGKMIGISKALLTRTIKEPNARVFGVSFPIFLKTPFVMQYLRVLDAKIDEIEKTYPGRKE